jgi:hypothetical protein
MPLPNVETDEETKLAIIRENNILAASEIMQAYEDAQELIASTKDYAGQAVDAVIRCGAMLNAKKKELGHTHWLKWRDAYLPELEKSHATIERYMALANSSQHEEFKSAAPKTITGAYRIAGILPDPVAGQRKRLNGQSKPLKPTGGNSNLRTVITEFRAQKAIEALIQIQDFSSWDEVELETISRLLAPITAAHSRMIHALSDKLLGTGGMMFES